MRVPSSGRLVREVGEFPLIEMMQGVVEDHAPRWVDLGIGDDAAVWRPRPGRRSVVAADMLVEGVHFRPEWTDWETLGRKALAVNLSDIAAMGARPRLALVSLGLRGTERDREVLDLYRGMNAMAAPFGALIVGGDTTSSPQGVVVAVTVIGEGAARKRPLMTRSGAQPGDVLGVTGPLGLAAAGLRVLERQLLTLDGNPSMREAYNDPQPRVLEGLILRRCGVRAALDLSDGLLGDLPKMCAASQVSAIVDLPRVPIPHAVQWGFPDWFDVALRGGDDYELLFACPPEVFERVVRAFHRAGLRAPDRIGEVIEAGDEGPRVRVREASGRMKDVEPGAYSHFG